jgi:NAD(P)-dependent dehydrogenase (short-subunit alcohol dehydrogenase family)
MKMNHIRNNCLVTGASSGLGLALSELLINKGYHVIMLCRSVNKGELAVSKLTSKIPDASADLMIGDLSSIKSIRAFIEKFKSKYSKLDILFNNAAVMKKIRTETEDGFEMMFQVNYLSSFILMNSFLEMLKNSSQSYIINNARPSSKLRLDMDDLQFKKNYSMYKSFFKTKLCLLLASLELSRKRDNGNISVTMIDPGPFKSRLVREVPVMGWVKNLFSQSVEKAAENICYHIESEDAKSNNGKVFKVREEVPLTEYWKDVGVSKRLWSFSEALVNDIRSY